MGQLQGKVAIITGAGSGFGEGMAEAYVREGAKVLIADLNAEAGERVAKSLGVNAKAVATDVANADSVHAMIKACVDAFGVPTSSSTMPVPRTKTSPCCRSMKRPSIACSP